MYVADGDYIKDIEVNDLRNRYLLTKGSTQKMVNYPLKATDSLPILQTKFAPDRLGALVSISTFCSVSRTSCLLGLTAHTVPCSFASADTRCLI